MVPKDKDLSQRLMVLAQGDCSPPELSIGQIKTYLRERG